MRGSVQLYSIIHYSLIDVYQCYQWLVALIQCNLLCEMIWVVNAFYAVCMSSRCRSALSEGRVRLLAGMSRGAINHPAERQEEAVNLEAPDWSTKGLGLLERQLHPCRQTDSKLEPTTEGVWYEKDFL